jgi:hypothetical protein
MELFTLLSNNFILQYDLLVAIKIKTIIIADVEKK